MTPEIAYVLALLVVALVLFATDVLSVDVVGLILLLALTVPGILDPADALAGFGNETIVVLIGLFVLTAGVTRTGVIERLGIRLSSFGASRPKALTRGLLVATTAISGFVSNTVTTAVFLPLTIAGAKRAKISAAKVLMPLAFASILAGSVTVIATSTNLVISGELPSYGMAPIGFFELAPVGAGVTVVGLLYLMFVAPRLIPDRIKEERIETWGLRTYISEAVIPEGSKLDGQKLGESKLGKVLDVTVLSLLRAGQRHVVPRANTVLREGDVLKIEGSAEDILSLKDVVGIDIRHDFEAHDQDLEPGALRMVEAMVLPGSSLARRSLAGAHFRRRVGMTVLAVHSPKHDGRTHKGLGRRRLRTGDVLLLQGTDEQISELRGDDLLVLDDVSAHHPRSPKGRIAAGIFVAALAVGATGLLPLSIAFLCGVLALLLTRCLTTEECYASIDWRLLMLIASMLAFGVAMKNTGTSSYLADLVVQHVSPHGSLAVLAAFFVLTSFLTQPMSNQAAALIVLPVAIEVARTLGLEARPLVMGVTFAASCSFLTPLEPACILVYGPGRYRFFDFARVGAPLTAVVFVLCVVLIPVFWPFAPA